MAGEMSVEEMKQHVQGSWKLVLPIADKVPGIFYPKLWEIAPNTEKLFSKTSVELQGPKLTKMLNLAVNGLNDLDDLVPKLDALARRHAYYSVTDDMYGPVGEALIYTLGAGLGSAFTPQVKAAWLKVYGIICSVMQPAMKDEIEKKKAKDMKRLVVGSVIAGVVALGAKAFLKK